MARRVAAARSRTAGRRPESATRPSRGMRGCSCARPKATAPRSSICMSWWPPPRAWPRTSCRPSRGSAWPGRRWRRRGQALPSSRARTGPGRRWWSSTTTRPGTGLRTLAAADSRRTGPHRTAHRACRLHSGRLPPPLLGEGLPGAGRRPAGGHRGGYCRGSPRPGRTCRPRRRLRRRCRCSCWCATLARRGR